MPSHLEESLAFLERFLSATLGYMAQKGGKRQGKKTVPRGKSHCSKVVAKSLCKKHLCKILVARQENKNVGQLFPTPNL